MLSESFWMKFFPDLLNKILAIMGLGLILFSLHFIITIPPASNYEFSIYNSYPIFFWLSIMAAIILGCGILINSGFNDDTQNNSWILGLLIILLANSILLFMPFIRGYLNFGSGDVLTHIGWMKDIIRTGHVTNSNMYPIDHILGVIIHFFSGLSLQTITMLIPAVFSIFFIISFYVFSRIAFSKQSERFFVLIFSSILIFGNSHMAFAPNPQAFMLMPIFLYLLYKNALFPKNRIFPFFLILMSTLLVFYHPLVSIMMILIFLLFKIFFWIGGRTYKTGFSHKNFDSPILLSIILFFSWSSYLFVLLRTVKPIIQSIMGSAETLSEFQRYSNILGEMNVDTFYLIHLIMNIYGQVIVLGLLSIFFSIYIFFKIIKNKNINHVILLSCFSFIVFFSISILMFFLNGVFGFGRIFSFALIFSLILIPCTILMLKSDLIINSKCMSLIVFITVIGIVWFSTFNLYYSPIIKHPNQQVTQSEYSGMMTFFKHRDSSIKILEHGLSQDRFYDAIYGRDYPRINVYYSVNVNQLLPPNHFHYDKSNSLGDAYDDKRYFLLTNQGRFFYQNMYPEFPEKWRFFPDDYYRLNYDNAVQNIYKNGNLEIRLIQ